LSLRATPSARTRAMSSPRRSRAACITAGLDDSESLATTGAPRGEDPAASRRLHASTKSVHARPPTGLWLVCTLHNESLLEKADADHVGCVCESLSACTASIPRLAARSDTGV
jgi:hypothetical protein